MSTLALLKRFVQRFDPPTRDPELLRRGRVSVAFALLMNLVAVAVVPTDLIGGTPSHAALQIAVAVAGATVVLPLVRTGRVRVAGHLSASLFTGVLIGTAWVEGGLIATGIQWLCAAVLFAVLVLGPRDAAVWVGVTSVAVLVIAGLGPPEVGDPRSPWSFAGAMALLYWTVFALAWVFDRARLAYVAQLYDQHRELLRTRLEIAEEQAANRAKSAFVARMSHELRTPLHTMLGYTELLGEELADRGLDDSEDLRRVQHAGKHLLTMIDGLLDLTRVELGLVLRVAPVDVEALLADAVASHRAEAAAAGIGLQLEASALGAVNTDRARLQQVIDHLLSNAIKFTPRGRITVRGRAVASGVEIDVEDTGIGIAAADLPRVFEPFEQVDASTTRRVDGAGLGLYLARALVHALGGTIRIASQPGVGSTFTVVAPNHASPAEG